MVDKILRGDVFLADLSPVIGSEQGGKRPVLIIQNDVGNHFSTTVIVAAITAKNTKANIPTHIEIKKDQFGFERDSVVLLEQLRTIDKVRILEKITQVDAEFMQTINEGLKVSLGLEQGKPSDENLEGCFDKRLSDEI